MNPPRLLIVPGSQRRGSLNLRLAAAAATQAASTGFSVQTIDLRALQLPVYDGDLEADQGVPTSTQTLHDAIAQSDALLFVTPEYNGFPTPLVINAMDWLSRLPDGMKVTQHRPLGLLSASPGAMGGLLSMNHLRTYLQTRFGMIPVPEQFALGKADQAFDAEGQLVEERARKQLQAVLGALYGLALALRAG